MTTFWVSRIYSLHIIGGDVIYKCISRDSIRNEIEYEIVFTMYRDSRSGGAQFDNPTSFGIYRGSAGSWRFERVVAGVRVENITDIDIATNNPCILVPVNVGVQRGVYTFTVILPIVNENYLISYQRCCRNNTICLLYTSKPPINVCDEDEGMPYHHVSRFQNIAAISPARMTVRVMYGIPSALVPSFTVFAMVLATP